VNWGGAVWLLIIVGGILFGYFRVLPWLNEPDTDQEVLAGEVDRLLQEEADSLSVAQNITPDSLTVLLATNPEKDNPVRKVATKKYIESLKKKGLTATEIERRVEALLDSTSSKSGRGDFSDPIPWSGSWKIRSGNDAGELYDFPAVFRPDTSKPGMPPGEIVTYVVRYGKKYSIVYVIDSLSSNFMEGVWHRPYIPPPESAGQESGRWQMKKVGSKLWDGRYIHHIAGIATESRLLLERVR